MLHGIEKTMKSINKVKKGRNDISVDLIIWLGHNQLKNNVYVF